MQLAISRTSVLSREMTKALSTRVARKIYISLSMPFAECANLQQCRHRFRRNYARWEQPFRSNPRDTCICALNRLFTCQSARELRSHFVRDCTFWKIVSTRMQVTWLTRTKDTISDRRHSTKLWSADIARVNLSLKKRPLARKVAPITSNAPTFDQL